MGSLWYVIAKETGKKIGKWASGASKKKNVPDEKYRQYDSVKEFLKDLFDIGY